MKLKFNLFVSIGVIASIATPGVHAWGAAGHEIVATIAQMHLYPNVLPILCSILHPPSQSDTESPGEPAQSCSLSYVATWADKFRYRMRWSGPLHYVGGKGDHPPQQCHFPGPNGWAGREGITVLGGIRNTTGLLAEWVEAGGPEGDLVAEEALKFLIHFVGDLHMPLHLTGRDRGGNSDKIRWDGRITNLHSMWDGLVVAKAIRTTPDNYTEPIPVHEIEKHLRGAIYDPLIRKIVIDGIGGKWKDEVDSWLECPGQQASKLPSVWQQTKQLVFGRTWSPGDTDDEVVCPYHWATPIHAMNCEWIWPKEMDEPPYGGLLLSTVLGGRPSHPYLELDTPEYGGKITQEWVVEKLFAMAGIRLAAILNYLFAVEEL